MQIDGRTEWLTGQRGYAVAAALVALAAAAGCQADKPQPRTNAAPAITICGKTLYDGAAGAVLTEATGKVASVHNVTSGAGIYLRFSSDCSHGVRVTFPAGAAQMVSVVRAGDGSIVAVGLRPLMRVFTVLARNQNRTTIVAVNLGS